MNRKLVWLSGGAPDSSNEMSLFFSESSPLGRLSHSHEQNDVNKTCLLSLGMMMKARARVVADDGWGDEG